LVVARRSLYTPPGRPDKTRRDAGQMTATPRLRWISAAASLLSPLLHDPAFGLPARLLLAPLDLAIAVTEVEAAERIRLDLDDRRSALLRVEAVHVAARAWRAVKLGEQD